MAAINEPKSNQILVWFILLKKKLIEFEIVAIDKLNMVILENIHLKLFVWGLDLYFDLKS